MNVKKVSLISWIPLQLVAFVSWIPIMWLAILLDTFDQWQWSRQPSFQNALNWLVTADPIVVTVFGFILLVRHEYGSRDFWKHSGIWYAVYSAFHIGFFVSCFFHLDTWQSSCIYAYAISFVIYPVIALLELILVITVAKKVSKKEKKDNEGGRNEN